MKQTFMAALCAAAVAGQQHIPGEKCEYGQKCYMPLMISTFFAQTVHLNHLDSMQDCVMESKDVIVDAGKFVEALMGEGDQDGAWDHAVGAALSLVQAVDGCMGSPEEIMSLKNWLMNRASTKQKMVDAASYNSIAHSGEMTNAVNELWDVTNNYDGEPILYGIALAKTAFWSLGPVKDADVVYPGQHVDEGLLNLNIAQEQICANLGGVVTEGLYAGVQNTQICTIHLDDPTQCSMLAYQIHPMASQLDGSDCIMYLFPRGGVLNLSASQNQMCTEKLGGEVENGQCVVTFVNQLECPKLAKEIGAETYTWLAPDCYMNLS